MSESSPKVGRLGCAVLLGIVLLVVGLLLPAISRVREAANHSTCVSHLKQISFGLLCYAEAYPQPIKGDSASHFLSGTVPNATLPPERRLSWYVPFLPYFEHDKLYQQFDLVAAADDDRNRQATEHRIKHFVCPSSGEHEYDNQRHHWRSATPVCHYIGIAGVGEDAAALPAGHARAGVFGYDRRTPLSNEGIPDGTSNTLLLVETSRNPGHWAYGGPATVRGVDPQDAPLIGVGRPFGGYHSSSESMFGPTLHKLNAAMADSTIRTFTAATDPAVFAALATVRGSEPVPVE